MSDVKIEKRIEVSVVFVQYNPDLTKTLLSLYALIQQKEISFEIIIADDGSKEDFFEEISDFFHRHSFSNYQLHKNKSNVGTVKNLLGAIKLSKGEYIFNNSPGDILKDKFVLRDLYRFSIGHQSHCVFSRAIYYHNDESGYKIIVKHCDPLKPKAFNWYLPRMVGKYSLFNRYWILGIVFFRKKAYAVKYLKAIESTSRLVEDNTSALYSVMDGEKIVFFDRIIAWYEADAPTTDRKASTSRNQISKDFSMTLQMVDEKFAKDPLYDFVTPNQNRFVRILKHPYIKICSMIFNHLPNEDTPSGELLEQELTKYLKETISCF